MHFEYVCICTITERGIRKSEIAPIYSTYIVKLTLYKFNILVIPMCCRSVANNLVAPAVQPLISELWWNVFAS